MYKLDSWAVGPQVHKVSALFSAVLGAMVGLCASGSSCAVAATSSRPLNIVLIVADDLNTALGCYGDPVAQTPNIDRLAARGVRFQRAYCQGSVCNSSRASLFSGLRPHANGVLDNDTPWSDLPPGVLYLPDFFQKQGYYTATFGKILDHKRVPDQPFWDLEVREHGKHPEQEQIAEKGQLYAGSTGSMYWAKLKGPDEGTPDGEVARGAAKLIDGQRGTQVPFLAAVGFRRPHTPYAVPAKYFDLYPWESLSLPDVAPPDKAKIPPGPVDSKPFRGNRVEALQALAAYYACISYVDAQVGVVLDALDRGDLWDNTIVVFLSDHGYHTGHQGRWHKGWLFEQTTLTPFIIAAPQAKPGVRRQIVELVDLYPTLVDLCGQPPVPALAGRSLEMLLRDLKPQQPRFALTSVGFLDDDNRRTYEGHSLRTDGFRYTEWDGGAQGIEFYAFADDPGGDRNLADDPAHAATIAALRKRLHELCQSEQGG